MILFMKKCLIALAGMVLILLATNSNGADSKLEKIVVSKAGDRFETQSGKPYIPWGLTYFRPETGWAPKVWRMFDPVITRADFIRLRNMGGNCVRVFLTYNEFLTTPDKVDESGLKKLDEFLKIAEETGVYVHPTGPDHWEGLPEWARGDRILDERVLSALEIFWSTIASRYKGRNVIFAYDLLNEPSVPWDSPSLKKKWNDWLIMKYGKVENAIKVWQLTEQEFAESQIPPQNTKNLNWLKDYQEFREDIAINWVRRQTDAIKKSDPDALVTVGLIQWSYPLFISNPAMYSGFRPSKIAPYLDFLEIHFYPLANGAYHYQGEEAELRNIAYLTAILNDMAIIRKPILIAEYGWYGGGTLPNSKAPNASEEQQAHYCERLVLTSKNWACGWLHWGMYDHPTATDVTRYIGLFKSDGQIKEWGKTFSRLGNGFAEGKISLTREKINLPTLDFDSATVNPQSAREFFEKFFESFKKMQKQIP